MGRYGYAYGYDYFAPSRPKEVKGGIKARTRSGDFGKSWWARRWNDVLESFQIGARLSRGKSYARKGQVVSLDIGKGRIAASVQGSRPKPYKVTIEVKEIGPKDWQRLAGLLAAQALFAAKLLAGEMPHEIEKVFKDSGLSLFPERLKDLETECSCPDWSNPCKHVAAVYYLMGEEFDRDPFLLFRLRGMAREELVALLGGGGEPVEPSAKLCAASGAATQPLSSPEEFWRGAPLPAQQGGGRSPALDAALLRQAGPFPFWRSERNLDSTLAPLYSRASARAAASLEDPRGAATPAAGALHRP